MLGLNTIQEIVSSLKENKLRTVLTGFSVSWGIFILIILLGSGNGLRNGVMSNFSNRAVNTVQMWSGRTSVPYQGLKSGRTLAFTEKQMTDVVTEHPEASEITGIINKQLIIKYQNESNTYRVRGVDPEYKDVYNLEFVKDGGRFINALDIKTLAKNVVIDKKMEEELFKEESAIGNYIQIGSVMFRVVGVNSKRARWGGPNAYIPFSTAQTIYNPDKKFYSMAFILRGKETKEANEAFDQQLKETMAKSQYFDSNDPQAIWISNSQRDYIETMKIFNGINYFVIVVGIFTLIAGIVGVSNIMLVSVKERTREFGIRKAIGAPPASILRSVIIESILITTLFGYIGMLLGIGITEAVNFIMEQMNAQSEFVIFKNPTVELSYILFATGVLIVSGILAGYMPARRAVRIKPIEAMREE